MLLPDAACILPQHRTFFRETAERVEKVRRVGLMSCFSPLTGCGKSNAAGVDLAGFFRYNGAGFLDILR